MIVNVEKNIKGVFVQQFFLSKVFTMLTIKRPFLHIKYDTIDYGVKDMLVLISY